MYPEEIKNIPKFSDLQYAAGLPDKSRVEVYEYMLQSMNEKTRIAFDYIAPGFGMRAPKFMGRLEMKKEMDAANKRNP